jgi:hypothetical protein
MMLEHAASLKQLKAEPRQALFCEQALRSVTVAIKYFLPAEIELKSTKGLRRLRAFYGRYRAYALSSVVGVVIA